MKAAVYCRVSSDEHVSAHTYYSALDPKKGVHPSTMRRIAKVLGVRPQDISEFVIMKHEPGDE